MKRTETTSINTERNEITKPLETAKITVVMFPSLWLPDRRNKNAHVKTNALIETSEVVPLLRDENAQETNDDAHEIASVVTDEDSPVETSDIELNVRNENAEESSSNDVQTTHL